MRPLSSGLLIIAALSSLTLLAAPQASARGLAARSSGVAVRGNLRGPGLVGGPGLRSGRFGFGNRLGFGGRLGGRNRFGNGYGTNGLGYLPYAFNGGYYGGGYYGGGYYGGGYYGGGYLGGGDLGAATMAVLGVRRSPTGTIRTTAAFRSPWGSGLRRYSRRPST